MLACNLAYTVNSLAIIVYLQYSLSMRTLRKRI